MLIRRPGRFALAYGIGSHAKHAAAAEQAGFAVTTVPSPALELDLDTPADIATFQEAPRWESTPAGRVLADHRDVPLTDA
jgi:2-phospho-L-lactate guanylyltransferase (CobY/MobA/RfbA family)